jgi:hypothetical protein
MALWNYKAKQQEMIENEKKLLNEVQTLKNNILLLVETKKEENSKKEKIEEKNDVKKEDDEQVKKLNSKINSLKSECSQLDDEIDKLNLANFQLSAYNDRLRQDVFKAEQKLDKLEKENKELVLNSNKKYKEIEDKYKESENKYKEVLKTSEETEKKLKRELENVNDLLSSKIREFDEVQQFVKLLSEVDAKILKEKEIEKEKKESEIETPLVFFAGIDKIVNEDEKNEEKNEEKSEKSEEIKYYENMIIEARKLLKSDSKNDKPEFTDLIVWYFDGDKGKEQYSSQNQADFEKYYNVSKTTVLSFGANGHLYTVDFNTMIQRNTTTKKERKVYREVIKVPVPKPIKFGNKVLRPFEIKNLDEKSAEFINMEKDFLTLKHPQKDNMTNLTKYDYYSGTQTNQKAKIIKIEKFYNDTMELMYETKKGIMKNKGELVLYHGTRSVDYLQPAKQGLDFRLSGTNTYFGKAIYLSMYPRYSHDGYAHKLANGNYVMLIVKCIVGNSKTYTSTYDQSLTRPPTYMGNELYDSVNMNIDGTHMYCVYDNSQCLVTHAIHYSI